MALCYHHHILPSELSPTPFWGVTLRWEDSPALKSTCFVFFSGGFVHLLQPDLCSPHVLAAYLQPVESFQHKMLKCNGKETSGTRSAKNYQHMQHHFPSALSAWQNWILQETGKPGHAPNISIKATRVQNCPLKGAKHHIASFGVMLLKEHWCTVWGLTKTSKSRFKNEWCIHFLHYFCFLSFIFSIIGFPGVLFLSFHSLFLHHVHSVQHKCKQQL